MRVVTLILQLHTNWFAELSTNETSLQLVKRATSQAVLTFHMYKPELVGIATTQHI